MLRVQSAVASYRERVEDAVGVFRCDDAYVLVVADGVGGMGGGARAAELVVERVKHVAQHEPLAELTVDRWSAVMSETDRLIQEDSAAGESTAVVAMVHAERVWGASVGDSEAWLVGEGTDQVLTEDQHRKRLGCGKARPVAFEGPFSQGALVLASDGLFGPASREAICSTLRVASPTPERLVDLARGRSGTLYDDVGLILAYHG